ncbi:hypothetical protein GCM10009799_20530 [Nocardiopsis rhodophaea]|uniref:Scaffolding protein n=1 Tax=Nocardiopsis rhodophaea TaxID=280238 RepID=A0ABP5ED41_9ACTN
MTEPTNPTNPQPAGDDPSGDPAARSAPAAPAPTDDAAPHNQGDGDELTRLDPVDLARMVRDLRKENASARTNAKSAAAEEARKQLAAELGKILDPNADEEADPAQLAVQLTAAQREAATLRTERAAEKAARKAGIDADALLDSRSFADKLGKLDASGDDFSTALDALVAEFADDPRYKTAGQAPARSGGDFSGGTGDTPDTPRSVDDFRQQRRKWRRGTT